MDIHTYIHDLYMICYVPSIQAWCADICKLPLQMEVRGSEYPSTQLLDASDHSNRLFALTLCVDCKSMSICMYIMYFPICNHPL